MALNDQPSTSDILLQQTNFGVKDDTNEIASKETSISDHPTGHSGIISNESNSSITSAPHRSRNASKNQRRRVQRRSKRDGVRSVKKQGSTISAASETSLKRKKRRERIGKRRSCSTLSSASGKPSKGKKRRSERIRRRRIENGCQTSSARPTSTHCQNRHNIEPFSENATIEDTDNDQVMPGAYRCDGPYDDSSSYEDSYTFDDSNSFVQSGADDDVAAEESGEQAEPTTNHSHNTFDAEDQSDDVHIKSSPSQGKGQFSWRSIPKSLFITIIASFACCAMFVFVSLMLFIWVLLSNRNDGTMANVNTDPPTTSPVTISEGCLNLFNPSSTCRNGREMTYVINEKLLTACDHDTINAIPCGGSLASFTNQEEYDIVMALIESNPPAVDYWLGASSTGTDQNNQHIFKWNDGSPPFNATWNPNESPPVGGHPGDIYAFINAATGYMGGTIGCGEVGYPTYAIYLLPVDYDTRTECDTLNFHLLG